MLARKQLTTLLFLSLAGFAQDVNFSTDVPVVNVFATVHDNHGRLVKDLNQSDFTLEEDGRPQTIRYFSRESGLPLTIGLLVDTSVSQQRLLPEERGASFQFLTQVLRPDKDRAFIIHFDREVELLQDLTASRERLADALAQLATPAQRLSKRKHPASNIGLWALGGTDLYDSVLLASDELMRKQTGRKALVLLTDGVDNGSKADLVDAIRSAERADTLVFAILFSDRDAYSGVYAQRNGKAAMQRVSRTTGGALFEVSAARPIASIYSQLEEELRNLYSIGYTPDRPADTPEYRKISLRTNRPDVEVHTRDGYYSKSQ